MNEQVTTTDLTLEGIREHARRQLGLLEKTGAVFSRNGTLIVTLTAGQWKVIEQALVAKSVDAADLKSAG